MNAAENLERLLSVKADQIKDVVQEDGATAAYIREKKLFTRLRAPIITVLVPDHVRAEVIVYDPAHEQQARDYVVMMKQEYGIVPLRRQYGH